MSSKSTKRDDTMGFYLAVGLLSLAIPLIAAVGFYLTGEVREHRGLSTDTQAP